MSVLVFIDIKEGRPSKSSIEAAGYAVDLAKSLGSEAFGVSNSSPSNPADLESKGLGRLIEAKSLNLSDTGQVAATVANLAESNGASVVIFAHDDIGKSIASRVAVRMNAGMVSGVTSLPETGSGFKVNKNVFSGKAIAQVDVSSEKRVLTLLPNSHRTDVKTASLNVESAEASPASAGLTVKEFIPTSTDGSISLPEADLVVSAGRGLKGPENWGMIEELAKELNAATACSRPVADIGWRPHHEHVGQTGVAIRPNLYIAIGISGAIQHLAGVNGSKTIVVINKDPEAPFFKAADYGIVGDAFEVVPKLIEAVKAYKAS